MWALDSSVAGVYEVNYDGTGLRRLADNGAHVTWSPDGSQVLFTGYMSTAPYWNRVFAVNADGSDDGHPRDLEPTIPGNTYAGSFSPDGSQMAFFQIGGSSPGGLSPNEQHIYIANADGSDPQMIHPGAFPYIVSQPMFTADGSSLVFIGFAAPAYRFSVYSVNTDGTDLHEIRTDVGRNEPDNHQTVQYTEVTPAPDGQHMFVYGTHSDGTDACNEAGPCVWETNLDGTGQRLIATHSMGIGAATMASSTGGCGPLPSGGYPAACATANPGETDPTDTGATLIPAVVGGAIGTTASTGNRYRIGGVQWATIRSAYQAYPVGEARRGWEFDAVSSKAHWVVGKVGGDYNRCGWIQTQHLHNTWRPVTVNCSHGSPRATDFSDHLNCIHCRDGTKVPGGLIADTEEYGNVFPFNHGRLSHHDPIRYVRAGEPVAWRYVTRDCQWVMVRDMRIKQGNLGHWVFVQRSALPATLPMLKTDRQLTDPPKPSHTKCAPSANQLP